MAEENSLDFQSALGILNQETFQQLYDEVCGLQFEIIDQNLDEMPSSSRGFLMVEAEPQLGSSDFQDGFANDNSNASETLPVEQIGAIATHVEVPYEVSSNSHVPSSLPASQNWPGKYGFTVSFNQQEKKNSKGVAWTFSKIKDKLYVGKDASCPVNFSVNTVLPDGFHVRAMALYSSPGQISEVVQRCIDHSMDELNQGLVEAQHLVRCDSALALYKVDAVTCRHSVVVPFENPQAGQHFSTYIYKFACFGSCAGGPNRRPLMIVFTLERNNEVVGRRKIDIKICACPVRDRKSEEDQFSKMRMSYVPVKMEASEFESSKRVVPPAKKTKTMSNKDGPYFVTTDDYECYELLKNMKKVFHLSKAMKGTPPGVIRTLFQ